MRKRILFAGLFHETHTFLDGTTALGDFAILRGAEMSAVAGDSSPLGGALESAAAFGWEVAPAVDFRAAPGPMVEDEVVEAFWKELAAHLATPLDGVFFVLHGAMVTPAFDDVEGELLARLRARVGDDLPIFGVLDLHANFTGQMAVNADCLVAYRENPHTDARAAAQLAASLLDRALTSGTRPRTFWEHPSIVWPPTGTGTGSEPMRSLEMLARQLEAESPEFLTVNVLAGFAFADMPEAGVSFAIATTGDERTARAALTRLAAEALASKDAGHVLDPPVTEIFAQLQPPPPGLTVLVEPSDNIGGGAPGDGTGLLRALVAHDFTNAAIAINDPAAVRALASLDPGAKRTLPIGGRGSRLDAGPLTMEVELVRLGDGRFKLEDPQSHLASMCGDHFDMGPCAVVRHGGLTILLTSNATPPFDLGQWRSQGIEPTALSFIAVKAAVAHRRAYDPIAARMLWAGTPGPCTSDLRTLPYRKIHRPVFPLDPLP